MANRAIWVFGALVFFVLVSTILLPKGVILYPLKDWVNDREHRLESYRSLPYSKTITNDMINDLNAPLPDYLPNTTNPCWYEDYPADSLYGHNGYRLFYAIYGKPTGSIHHYFKQMNKLTKRREPEGRRMRCLPSAYVIGFPKCGTTDMTSTLKLHPGVSRDIPLKELNFWHTHIFNRLPGLHKTLHNSSYFKTFGDYVDLFDKKILKDEVLHTDKLIMEGTPSYIWNIPGWRQMSLNKGKTEPSVTVAHLIRHFTPNAKFIITVRNPADLMYSHYFFFRIGDGSNVDFHHRLVQSIDTMKRCMAQNSLRSCVYGHATQNQTRTQLGLEIGHYATFIRDWFSVFPREQFYISRLEDYSQNKERRMKEIVRFLGLRPSRSFIERVERGRVHNKNKNYDGAKMLPKSRRLLEQYYAESNKELAILLRDPSFRYDA